MVTISYQIKKNVNKKIEEVLALINLNHYFLEVIARIDINMNMNKLKKSNKISKVEIINNILEEIELTGEIPRPLLDEFKGKWVSLSNEEIGTFLEELIAMFGPYEEIRFTDFDYSRNSSVREINSEKDFDVIFYDTNQYKNNNDREISIGCLSEFHECKKNIRNEIPRDKKKKEFKFKQKLEYMKEVYKLNQKAKYFIPTLAYDVQSSQEYLNENGYSFFRIISIKDIIERYG